jgi:hypothetical protein
MMGNNFGLFRSKESARLILKKFARITTPDARIIAKLSIHTSPTTRYTCRITEKTVGADGSADKSECASATA